MPWRVQWVRFCLGLPLTVRQVVGWTATRERRWEHPRPAIGDASKPCPVCLILVIFACRGREDPGGLVLMADGSSGGSALVVGLMLVMLGRQGIPYR